jgi:vanillate monooxygenase
LREAAHGNIGMVPAVPCQNPAVSFPKNAWYVACSAEEIDGRVLGRRVCNESIVFFRGPDGSAVGLEDWCPHRGAPLSLGQVRDGSVTCGYHGLEMGADGRTIAMPGQRVRAFPTIRTFPTVLRHGFVWVWPGDPGTATADAIPDLAWASSPGWTFGGGMFRVACDYRLMIDNLMDLTHETYVHVGSIGQKEIDEAPCTTTVNGDEVVTSRFMNAISAPPFWQMGLRGNGLPDDLPVDRWQVCRFTPPSHVMIEVGVALAGKGGYDAPSELGASGIVVDFITPETESSIWYFWGMARRFRPDDTELTASIRDGQSSVFAEDIVMLEAQQRNLLANPGRRLLKLNIDHGAVQARRVIDRMLAEERFVADGPSGDLAPEDIPSQ